MNFARYIGEEEGWTVGKVYLSDSEMDPTMIDPSVIEIVNDNGDRIRVRPEEGNWEFLEEVYAACLTKINDDLRAGQVVRITDAEKDIPKAGEDICKSIKYQVAGVGYQTACNFVLLDRTNLFPGVLVREEATGDWSKVAEVDDALWFSRSKDATRRSPEEFSLAVAAGNVDPCPVATCIRTAPSLTVDEIYQPVRSKDGKITVVNDDGAEQEYGQEIFAYNPFIYSDLQ